MALLAFAVMSACFMIPWCFAYVRTPEEKGLKPLGEPVNVGSKSQDDPEGKHGVSLKRIFRSPVFYLLLFSTMCISIMQGYENSFPAIADEGLTNTVYAASAMTFAAVMLSVDGLFDLFGALLAGTVIDKIGIKAATRIWALILLVMFISLIWFRDVPLGLYVGGACFGAQTCIRRSIIPLITRQIFGPRNFAKTIGYISVGTGVVNGVSSTFIAYSYDLTSGYQLALQTGFVIAICAAILLVTCLFFIGKYAWTTVEEEILGS
jgi:MFS family permease